MAANEAKIVVTADDKASKKLTGITAKAKQMRTAFLAVGGAATGLGIASIKFASDLDEAANKAAVTFGEAAGLVQDFAKTSATQFGISERAANEYAGTLGTILTATGQTQAEASGMSVTMVKLAADMASFNNIGMDEALNKIRAGLVGEAEPLRTVGVLLSAAAVQSYAYQEGIAAVGAELTEGQKVQARYGIILEQTKKQQGDFQRTSDSLANSTRVVKAQLEDAAASLGMQLLPAAQKVVGVISQAVEKFSNLSPEVKTTILVIGGVAGALAALGLVIPPVIGSLGLLTGAFKATFIAANLLVAHPVIAALAAMTAAVTLGVVATKKWVDSQETAEEAAERLKQGLDNFRMSAEATFPGLDGVRERINEVRKAEYELSLELEEAAVTNTEVTQTIVNNAQFRANAILTQRGLEKEAIESVAQAEADAWNTRREAWREEANEAKERADAVIKETARMAAAAEALQKEEFAAVMAMASVIDAPTLGAGVSFGTATDVNALKQMGGNAQIIGGKLVTQSVTGQYNLVQASSSRAGAGMQPGTAEFDAFVAATVALNRQLGNTGQVVINGDVYGLEDFEEKVVGALANNANRGGAAVFSGATSGFSSFGEQN
jgi:hypothetical protein